MATHSSTLAQRIPWTEEPGGLQSHGVARVKHNLATTPPPYVPCHVYNGKLLYNRELSPVLCDNIEGWGGVGRVVPETGVYVYLRLIHVVRQKPTQYCKALTLQLIFFLFLCDGCGLAHTNRLYGNWLCNFKLNIGKPIIF